MLSHFAPTATMTATASYLTTEKPTAVCSLCTGNNVQETDNRPLSPMMRAEVQKLDKYIEEYQLLCDNHIESPKELLSFQEDLSDRIVALEQERYAVQLKIRRAKTPEDDAALKAQSKEITKQITPLRKQRDKYS